MVSGVHRKLTTILAADAVDYSRRMGEDEVGTITSLRTARRIIDAGISRHDGRIANTAGDGLIAEFPSVVEAVTCAIEIQRELADQPHEKHGLSKPLQFRIGLHLGDVIVDGHDLLGDGVNLASRLEAMADPGGILLSQQVYDQVHSKLSVGFEFLGDKRPRNLVDDVPVYRVAPAQSARAARWTASVTHAREAAGAHVRQGADDLAHTEEVLRGTAEHAMSNVTPRMKKAGIVLAGLAVIDLVNGLPFFVHWPALALLVYFAWSTVPDYIHDNRQKRYYRGGVALAALFAVLLFSLTGIGWLILLALGVGAIHLLRQAQPQKE